MLPTPKCVKMYQSAKRRFVKPAIEQFLRQEFPKCFGPIVAQSVADEILKIFQSLSPPGETLMPGQIFWNALDQNTRADSKNVKFVPVVLTVVNEHDIKRYTDGIKVSIIVREAIARMIREAYAQGGILSNRDIALLTLRSQPWVSTMRMKYEKEHNVVLPHTGALHDMGPCLTHKEQIIYKVVVQKKDPKIVAAETNHSQKAVDHYLSNYNRVKTVYQSNPDPNHIHFVTQIAKNVVKQYIRIYELYQKQ